MAREESRRRKRVASLIMEALGRILMTETDPAEDGLVTVTRVEPTVDLRAAKVYVSVYGPADPAEVVGRLERRSGAFRRLLASAVELKYNPQLFFTLDPSAAESERLEELLRRTKEER